MKILIVEDEPSLREIMVQTLRREQYVVEQAADYASALDKIAGYDYDCILLDIMLPDGSGLQLLEELKRQRRQAGIIIISARDSLDDKIEGLEHEKCMINIDRNGNTTAATIPSCLYDYEKELRKGDNLILSAFGGGYTWGAIYVKWAYDGSKACQIDSSEK